MSGNLRDMIKAGLVSHICRYYDSQNGNDPDWRKTTEYAMREFRDLDSIAINRLIAYCRQSCLAGLLLSRCQPGETIHPDIVPKIGLS